jgi:pyruvate/2-oxoglutarate dehydrogenase complex dihydrolipoamide acyltransferase (E2) component
MEHELLVPLMGEGITEVTLVEWLKETGDKVEKDEPLLLVSTDKVDTEIPSPRAGTLAETLAKAGSTVAVNAKIAIITSDLDSKADAPAKKATLNPKTLVESVPISNAHKAPSPKQVMQKPQPSLANAKPPENRGQKVSVRSSPLVRKMARELDINLSQVKGTGHNGRITKRDIAVAREAGLDPRPLIPESIEPQQIKNRAPELGLPRLSTRTVDGVESVDGVVVRRVKMTKMRRLIAYHMVASTRTAPHATMVFEIDLGRIVKLRELYQEGFAKREGFKLTYTPFFIHGAAIAIENNPIVNVSVDGDEILFKDDINIGCAVALESGLIVPVIKKVGGMNLVGIARSLNDLVGRARSKKLTAFDVQGGTFSITNPGMWGSVVAAPIINQPQVAIMSIGAIQKKPVVIDDMIGIRPLIQIGLTFDHRVVDGEGAAKFLRDLKQSLENYSLPEFAR